MTRYGTDLEEITVTLDPANSDVTAGSRHAEVELPMRGDSSSSGRDLTAFVFHCLATFAGRENWGKRCPVPWRLGSSLTPPTPITASYS
jgi:hypothetical protein